ncbi:MAG: aminotransferase class IV [Limisphaerales bacterium]
MIVYLNGRFVPEDQACVSIDDRGFLYGDALFETIRFYDSEPFLWHQHMARLRAGCHALGIKLPLADHEMLAHLYELIRQNNLPGCIARITITRGVGRRGYSPRGADHPTLCIALSPLTRSPASYKVITSSIRLPSLDPLATFKHSNKLRQVLARAEADAAGADEALLLNDRDEVVEGTSTNLFWIEGETLFTPPVEGILPGTTRLHLLILAAQLLVPTRETHIRLPELLERTGVFVTSCGIEVMEVSHINGHPIPPSPIAQRLRKEYR